jgi:hypothetical protein
MWGCCSVAGRWVLGTYAQGITCKACSTGWACQILIHLHHPSNLQVRPLGVNMLVADVFDAGLLGDGFSYLLELARRQVLQPGATVVPAGKARLNGLHCRKDTKQH